MQTFTATIIMTIIAIILATLFIIVKKMQRKVVTHTKVGESVKAYDELIKKKKGEKESKEGKEIP